MRSILATTALLLSLQMAGCGRGDDRQQVLGTLERERLELVAESHERIVEIAVQEGERVTADAVLLRQEAGTMQPRLEQARASVTEAERRLAELVAGPRQREIEDARAALAGAESTLTTERREYERVKLLVDRKLLSASELDRARSSRDAATAARDRANAQLRLLLEGTRSEQVQQAQAALERARAALAELETSAARYLVKAPRPGLIEALPYEVGERPPAGTAVVVMLADAAPYARVYVPEPLRSRFLAGAKVRVNVDGRTEPFSGIVRYVSSEASFTPYFALTQKDRSRLSYLCEITLTDPAAAELPTGMPVQVTLAEDAGG
jgi:HlyD family secretion protein